ncbi:MAG TPA: hypothetical protein PLK57_07425 [Clostridiales bacterium]|nr:hypothetical protein [Clostridiales bacterium]
MEKFKWEIVETEICTEDSQSFRTNGVKIVDQWGFEFVYPDISLVKEDVQNLIKRVGHMDIAREHLLDIIHDYIEELAGVDIYVPNKVLVSA